MSRLPWWYYENQEPEDRLDTLFQQQILDNEEMQQAIEEQMAGHLVTELVALAKDKE